MHRLLLAAMLAASLCGAAVAQFDHTHAAWTELLRKHVVVTDGGKVSSVRYAGMQQDRAALTAYRETLARVPAAEFRGWSPAQQLALLINAYNANTIELILTRHPNIGSIWDFGKVFNHPFKQRFVRLLGRELSLDDIEHGMIRAEGAYEDPRIHFAVNCAAIGCPMLREEAYAADRLDRQLDEQTQRFLSDRSRNRYNPQTGALEVSRIFDWYGEDFRRGWKGVASPQALFAKHAGDLADRPQDRQAVREARVPVRHLQYDWRLNDAR